MNSVAHRAPTQHLKFLQGYPADTLAQVAQLMADQRLGEWLHNKYPDAHGVRTDKALFEYVQALKANYLRGAEPLAKVAFDSKLQVVQHALGTHTSISRVQGIKLKAKREIRIAALFKDAPPEFLCMISVHELAHLKERAHDKAFYQLCCHMEPRYHQLEFELRVYLTHLDTAGARLWGLRGHPTSPATVKNAVFSKSGEAKNGPLRSIGSQLPKDRQALGLGRCQAPA